MMIRGRRGCFYLQHGLTASLKTNSTQRVLGTHMSSCPRLPGPRRATDATHLRLPAPTDRPTGRRDFFLLFLWRARCYFTFFTAFKRLLLQACVTAAPPGGSSPTAQGFGTPVREGGTCPRDVVRNSCSWLCVRVCVKWPERNSSRTPTSDACMQVKSVNTLKTFNCVFLWSDLSVFLKNVFLLYALYPSDNPDSSLIVVYRMLP